MWKRNENCHIPVLSKLFKRTEEKRTLSARLFRRKREREWKRATELARKKQRARRKNCNLRKWEWEIEWKRECAEEMKERWEKDSVKGRKYIPAALTLNTYYTCYAIDKFILYLYRDRIYDVYCTWYYIYTGCYTLSISKTSISPRAAAANVG